MADFQRVNYGNSKMKQSEITNRLGYSSSTLQRYRDDVYMVSPYRIQSKKRTNHASNTNFDKNSHTNHDVKRPQMTSNYLKTTQTNAKSNKKNKKVLKGGSLQENIEITEHYLHEILDTNKI